MGKLRPGRLSIVAIGVVLGVAATAHAQSISRNRVASHQLGFSGATISVREDYRTTKWPAAHRILEVRRPDGRAITLRLADGGAADLNALSLYKRTDRQAEFVLIGARECVSFDPIVLKLARCGVRPPCRGDVRPGWTYLGRFDWATGYGPPKGDFQFGWRFLPLEDGSEESFCDPGQRGYPPVDPPRVTVPSILRGPSPDQIEAALPPAAGAMRQSGFASLTCRVTATGSAEDCILGIETPKGDGFGPSAMALAHKFVLVPKTINGTPQDDGYITLVVVFPPTH